MLCYGGPIDGHDVDRADPVYVHKHVFEDDDGNYECTRFYRYQSTMFHDPDPRPGAWPTGALRPLLVYVYVGEYTDLHEAGIVLAPAERVLQGVYT